ncbi:MAG TPA: sigma-70 family RNA polymerase sigma factor [Planctomycetota bacterium]|nr:sigma-70 family RNA polymerase sigma factor [Planctomycetota bacterium]
MGSLESKGMKAASEEARLLALARSGSSEAFDRLVELHQDRVYGLLLRLTGSAEDAEDLAQECFLRACRALDQFQGGSAFYTWLYRIALNLARSGHRSERRRRGREVPMAVLAGAAARQGDSGDDGDGGIEMAAIESGPDELAERREMVRKVQEALEDLSGDHREVVVLRDIEGLDYEEIADLVGVSREAVKSRLHRARGELATRLRRMGCEL